MATWGPGNFENDAALDFIDQEIDRHVQAIEAIFADDQRFRLDEDAEGELIPRIAILALLYEHCAGVFTTPVDVISAWKARYLDMYDDQIDDLEPKGEYKPQRRAAIVDTFDTLIRLHHEQQRDKS